MCNCLITYCIQCTRIYGEKLGWRTAKFQTKMPIHPNCSIHLFWLSNTKPDRMILNHITAFAIMFVKLPAFQVFGSICRLARVCEVEMKIKKYPDEDLCRMMHSHGCSTKAGKHHSRMQLKNETKTVLQKCSESICETS